MSEDLGSESKSVGGLAARVSLPVGYEPRYPYPLMVLFHGRGGNEEQVQRLVPHLSGRNYICLSLRGPEVLGERKDGTPACSWGSPKSYTSKIEDSVLRAIHWTLRAYHVHSERIYLAGLCDGSSVAYRIGLNSPESFGGVIALNGQLLPAGTAGPIFRMDEVRGFRVFIGHGIANAKTPLSLAEDSFKALYAAGADVKLMTYPTTHRLHGRMLRDINRWVIDRINAEHDALVIG